MNRKDKDTDMNQQQGGDLSGSGLRKQGYGSSQENNQDAGQGYNGDAGMRNVRQQDRAVQKQDYDEDIDSDLNRGNRAEQPFDRDKSTY